MESANLAAEQIINEMIVNQCQSGCHHFISETVTVVAYLGAVVKTR